MHHFGWVPTVTGNLSFSTLGEGSFPAKCLRTDASNGFVICQRRDLLDVLIPYADDVAVARFFREKLANWVFRLSGNFTFVMVARPDHQSDSCRGQIYLVAHATHGKGLKKAQKEFQQSDAIDDAMIQFASSVSSMSCHAVDFELERQGKFRTASQSSEDNDDNVNNILANQVFFFVKDVSHVHQHHDPKFDAITEVSCDSDPASDLWVDETQHALYRSIIRYKRFRNERALFRASGILAYAQAFQSSYVENDTRDSQRKAYHQAELEQSLKVSREEIKHFDQKRLAKIETFRNFFFALFGLAISVTFLARLGGPLDVTVNENITAVAALLAAYPFEALGITMLASSVWMVLTHQRDPAESEFVRWVTRLTQSFRLRYYIISNVVITALLSAGSYYLLLMASG